MSAEGGDPSTPLARWAGGSALAEAALYLLSFAGLALQPRPEASATLAQKLDFVLAHRALFQLWAPFYLASGALLVPLALGLHARLKDRAPALLPVATSFALIWAGLLLASGLVGGVGLRAVARLHLQDPAHAVPVWAALNVVQDALGGGVEVVGGLWTFLISLAALRARRFPRLLNGLGLAVGLAGILTLVPGWGDLAALFGIGQIPWFLGLGLGLLRRPAA